MNRYSNEQDYRRGRERPRDEYGRFESEPDKSRYAERDTNRYGEENYGMREDRGVSRYDRGDYEWNRGYQQRFDENTYDRPDREAGRNRSGNNWDEQPSYGRGDGRESSMNRGYGGYRSASERMGNSPREYGDNYSGQGLSQGTTYRTESLFSVPPSRRGNGLNDFDGNRGQYAGRGPKGYRRSDERLEEDVNEALTRNPEIDATEIEVKVSNGEVTLTGMVADRNIKRLAEDIVERCPGVHDVRNDIRVHRETESANDSHHQTKGKSSSGTGMESPKSKTA